MRWCFGEGMRKLSLALFAVLFMGGCGDDEKSGTASSDFNKTSTDNQPAKSSEVDEIDLEDLDTFRKIFSVAKNRDDLAWINAGGEKLAYGKDGQTPYSGWLRELLEPKGHQFRKLTQYKNGKIHGVSMTRYENGKIRNRSSYSNGKLNGVVTEWFDNGQKKSESIFKNGKQQGLEITWYMHNGQKWGEGNFSNGQREGIWTSWFDNGQKKSEGSFQNGKMNGSWIFYSENGSVRGTPTFRDGEVIED